jgi:hypothetical protein
MTKNGIISTKLTNVVLLNLDEDTEFSEIKEAFSATISNNQTISWAKFILTDDQPNENKMRIPQEEFSNLIKTGTYMPFKMAYEKPKDGHEESYPLGVIAQLKQSGNQIVALAALWRREREQDIDYLKTCIAEKIPVNVSWEILHEDSKIDEAGIEDLIGTSLRGVTIVGRPAYAGRTPVLQVASKDKQDSNSEENTVEELEKLQLRVSELEATLATKDTELIAKDTLITEKETELASLREFKTSIEQKEAATARFLEVKELFSKSGIEKPDTYFEENKEKLLGMEKSDLEFMLQELVAFSSTQKNASKKDAEGNEIPDLTGDAPKELTIKDLADELRKGS